MEHLAYLTDHYAAGIERINGLGAPLNFVFITDMHNRLNHWGNSLPGAADPMHFELAANAVRSIQYILDRCPGVQFVVSGGDIGNDYEPDVEKKRASYREVMDALYALSVPVHCVIGNHDDGLHTALARGWDTRLYGVGPQELHDLCMRNNPTRENYYFFDVGENWRFVLMNTSDIPYYKDENGQYPLYRQEISDRQARWLEQEALATGRRIILISHAPLHNAGIYGTENARAPYSRPYMKPYDDVLNAPRAYYAVTQCPNVAAMIAGHVHFDNLIYQDDIAMITTQSALMQTWTPACPERAPRTVTETAFDVFSVRDDVMYITRFGAGCDREAHLVRGARGAAQ